MGQSTSLFRRPKIFGHFSNIITAESTRHGGISPPPYDSLNLGLFTGDTSANVQTNRRLFFENLRVSPNQVVGLQQVHGDQVLVARSPGIYQGYDALVTQEKDLLLTITVADCVPVLLYDPKSEALAAIHAGWRGTRAGITVRTLQVMQDLFGTVPVNCFAYVGTSIDADSYEVDNDVADRFDEPYKQFNEKSGKFLLDLKTANADQLKAAKVMGEQIEVSPFSTVSHNEDYFSYRRDGAATGRMLAVIGLRG